MILCNASMNYLHFTFHLQILSGGKAKINLHTMLKLTVFMPTIMFFFFNMVMPLYSCHSLNGRKVINLKRNFKENIIKKYLGKRITKEVVIIRIESYFAFH